MRRLLVTQYLDAATKPVGFVREAISATNPFKRAITFEDVATNTPLQLAQTDRAKMKRATIAFGKVIRAVHQAVKISAVGESEHVARLVCEHFAAPPH